MLKCRIYSLGSKNPCRLSCWINLSLPPPTPTPNQVSHSRECNLLCCDIVVNLQSGPHSREPMCLPEEAMAPHCSTLAWKVPWTEEPGGLQPMGLWRRLSTFTFPFHFQALEKAMATHSSVLAWRIPGMGELGGLPSVGSHRVGHD